MRKIGELGSRKQIDMEVGRNAFRTSSLQERVTDDQDRLLCLKYNPILELTVSISVPGNVAAERWCR